MAKTKKMLTVAQVVTKMYENCNEKAYAAAELGISVAELTKKIESEIYPKALKDIKNNIISDDVLIYIKEECLKMYKICKEKGVYTHKPASLYDDFVEPQIKNIDRESIKEIVGLKVDIETLRKIKPDLQNLVAKAYVYANKNAVSWFKIFETARLSNIRK